MNENTFEAYGWYLLSILNVFGWTKTVLEPSDGNCYWFWAFLDGLKRFWRLQMVFAIIFSVFGWTKIRLLSILRVFGCTKKLLNRLQVVFAIYFERFRMDENTFKYFKWYLLLVLSVSGWTKTLLKASDGICYWF